MTETIECIGFEGTYVEQREWGGKIILQEVREYVIATKHGVLHLKICTGSGKVRTFVDTDWGKPSWWGSRSNWSGIQTDPQWKRAGNKVRKAGSEFSSIVAGNTTELFKVLNLGVVADFARNPPAEAAWKHLCGDNGDAAMLNAIMDNAEEIVRDARQEHLKHKAVEMALVDDKWGMF